MLPICDYHIHTPLCGHAEGQPEDYAEKALALGLEEIGFSDHAPLLSHRAPDITMDMDELPAYHKTLERVQGQFRNRIRVKIGIEADFLPPYVEQTRALLQGYPYDFVIGSVHFLEGWAFDDPAQVRGWDDVQTDTIYRQYYDYLRQSARSGLFDIIAHVDLVKKFGHRPKSDMSGEVAATAEVFKQAGVAIEINTSGLRKPVKEIYPSPDVLKIYRQAGVPVTFGSDAHAPDEVGRDFDQAIRLARSAGYSEYILFRQRKIERRVPIRPA